MKHFLDVQVALPLNVDNILKRELYIINPILRSTEKLNNFLKVTETASREGTIYSFVELLCLSRREALWVQR